MKKNKLKIIALVLVILLIMLVSFIGIYQKKLNKMENILPEYILGMDFGEKRVIRLDVNQGTEIVYYDENGNEIEHTHEEGEEHSEEENITSRRSSYKQRRNTNSRKL